jgi:hypothetical protein
MNMLELNLHPLLESRTDQTRLGFNLPCWHL